MRLGVIEFDGREETFEESIELARRFAAKGLDLLDVSLGFNIPGAEIPWGPAFMAPMAERIRKEAKIPTATSWYINEPRQADALIRDGKVDLVMLGRALLANPHWPYEAAKVLGIDNPSWVLPAPYAHWLERYRTAREDVAA
jgi:NADPH2 dehydrogenase